jgi:hypothetical protein
MPIDQATLNAQAAEAAAFLARVLARHIGGSRTEEADGYITILLDNLYQSDRPITIDTRNAEITVEFGECHSHFTESDGEIETRLVGGMVEQVVGIVSGQVHSYSAHAGELCLGGGWLRAGEATGRMIEWFPDATHFKVVAWAPWDDLQVTRPQFHSRRWPLSEADSPSG